MASEVRPRLRLVTASDDPPVRRRPGRPLLRIGIAIVGLGQISLGLAQLAGFSLVDMVDGGHIGDESAAWNIAVGTALLWVARTGRCPTGVLIMLAGFVGVLSLVTLSDALDGDVGLARLATHLVALTGCALITVLRRRTQLGNHFTH
jgi:predicted anti-sigma-YlaC factor YlaD